MIRPRWAKPGATAVCLAEALGFDETRQGTAALIVTEAASNLIKHAGAGELIVQGMDYGPAGVSLEILALDSGRGMSDVGRCVADGYSTAGSPGTGLGAIIADGGCLRDLFESGPGHRSVGSPRPKSAGRPQATTPGWSWESWEFRHRERKSAATTGRRSSAMAGAFVLLVDGLGHGEPAAQAAEEAVRIFRAHQRSGTGPNHRVDPSGTREHSRGGPGDRPAGSGRARGPLRGRGQHLRRHPRPATGARTSMVSQNGTVGYAIRKIQTYQYPWNDDSLLLMHSDGLATHWDLDRYPGLLQMHPSLIAGALYRDHKRGRDDVTVLAAG